jgi:hypothetical protein
MIITVTQDQKNNVFIATITTTTDALDMAYIDAYGEPTVDQAGTITYYDNSHVEQTFVISGGPLLAYVRSGMPITFSMSFTIDALAMNKVIGWGNTMVARIQAAMTTLKDQAQPNVPNSTIFPA